MLKIMECFVCFEKSENVQKICEKCGWHICPKCNGCLCNLTPEHKKIARAVYKSSKSSLQVTLTKSPK